jgi:hypothetical protein
MRTSIQKLSDWALARVLGEKDAGACIPNDPYYRCYSCRQYYCYNNCAGQYYCSPTGRPCC